MFSGIIECMGRVEETLPQESNISFWISIPFAVELKIDQSVAHNGVCLTVDALRPGAYRVTAIQETLSRTNLGGLQKGSTVNLERSLTLNTLLDGHLVQGHVDTTGVCTHIRDADGSRLFTFSYPPAYSHLLVEKGSVAINGVSLTAFDLVDNTFTVAIIPYTLEHTTFGTLKEGSAVNLEFDIIGKYVARIAGR
jgi:riboflavin synthase